MLAGIREIVTISSPESIGNVYAYSTAAINSVSLCPIRLSSFMSEPITEAETTFRKVFKGPDREAVRRSKDTANRVLSMVKALLNHALRDPTNGISDDHAWRLVKPFRGVSVPRAVHFSVEQARALIGAAPDKDFADLLTAGFLTGARYGELIACSVRDFDPVAKTLKVDGKTGPRAIIFQPEVVTFFKLISKHRAADEPLLRRSDGARWSRSHQQRRMALALERAGLDSEGTFYALRH